MRALFVKGKSDLVLDQVKDLLYDPRCLLKRIGNQDVSPWSDHNAVNLGKQIQREIAAKERVKKAAAQ